GRVSCQSSFAVPPLVSFTRAARPGKQFYLIQSKTSSHWERLRPTALALIALGLKFKLHRSAALAVGRFKFPFPQRIHGGPDQDRVSAKYFGLFQGPVGQNHHEYFDCTRDIRSPRQLRINRSYFGFRLAGQFRLTPHAEGMEDHHGCGYECYEASRCPRPYAFKRHCCPREKPISAEQCPCHAAEVSRRLVTSR